MNWWGKIVGSSIGLLGGPFTALIGAYLGHQLDENQTGTTDEQKAKLLYYAYFFSCVAKIAKADGGISQPEIETVQSLIDRMKLTVKQQNFAKEIFRKAKSSRTPVREYFSNCARLIQRDRSMALSFLGGMYEVACAGGSKPSEMQLRCLLIGEEMLALPRGTIRSWLSGQYLPFGKQFKMEGGDELRWAYRILGITEDANIRSIKSAYREKMARLHPDKLAGQKLPHDLLVFTNEQAALLNQAYDEIGKARGFKKQSAHPSSQ